jgi:3-keto-L-gulonate-6-phosphate decarboxylase
MDNYVYHDRKMMKWLPFSALSEQGQYLQNMFAKRRKKTMPVLSVDAYETMNYLIEEAIEHQFKVTVEYYEHDRFQILSGIISKLYFYQKTIFIDAKALSAHRIISIERC